MQIRAALAKEPNKPFSVESVKLDDPRADEVLVKLVATGMCHTDIAIVEQIVPLPMPIVLGHEGAGIVEKVGSNVKGLSAGDHVVLAFNSCGHCKTCGSKHPAYCDNAGPLNFGCVRPDGSPTITDAQGKPISAAFFGQSSFGTYALSSAQNTIKVRKDAQLKYLGPLGCGLMTGSGTVLNVLKPDRNSTFAIFGCGALGFAALFGAKILGAGRIIAVDRVQSRLDLAKSLGADEIINTSNTNLGERLAALGGIDCAIDTTGVPRVVEPAIGGLKVGGTLALVGASHDPNMTVNIMHMISGRVIRGVVEGDSNPPDFIPYLVDQFMAGKFPIDRLVQFYPLDRINDAMADSNSGKTIKPILEF